VDGLIAARRAPTALATTLLISAATAWTGVLVVARHMRSMSETTGLGLPGFLGLWTLMTAAMMLPSVTPFALLYARTINDRRATRLASLVAGYLLVWTALGLPAYWLARLAGQIAGGSHALATAAAVSIFALCGVYQLTPMKQRCLVHCRSPLAQLVRYAGYRRPARELRVGVHHGGYCVGCCWAFMTLLVALGMMNVIAMAALAAVVLVEKQAAHGEAFARLAGVAALALALVAVWVPALAAGLHAARAPM
jgi:predicted metal-binding membrane protein